MRWLIAAALAAVAVAAWLLLRTESGAPPRTAAPAGEEAPETPPDRLSAPRAALPPPPGAPREEPKEQLPETPAETPAEKPDPGLLHVRILDRAAAAPVAAFRYVLHVPGRARAERAVAGHEVELRLPFDVDARLRIEADGFAPQEVTVQVPAAEPERAVRLELERALALAGVELRVQTADFAPVAWLSVRARRLVREDVAGVELWHRRASNPDGVYDLPLLEAGTYELELQALTEEGATAPLLPHVERVVFAGAESIARLVQLEPGALLELELRDARGALIGEDVAVALELPGLGDPGIPWQSMLEGEPVVRRGGLPANARAVSARALPAGVGTLRLRWRDGPVHERQVVLRAGETVRVEMALPD